MHVTKLSGTILIAGACVGDPKGGGQDARNIVGHCQAFIPKPGVIYLTPGFFMCVVFIRGNDLIAYKVGHGRKTSLSLSLRAAELSKRIRDAFVPGIYSKASISKDIGAFFLVEKCSCIFDTPAIPGGRTGMCLCWEAMDGNEQYSHRKHINNNCSS